MIPDYRELARLDFRQLVDRLAGIATADLANLDPDLLLDADWPSLDEQFREGFVANCGSLSDDEWLRCDALADTIFAWMETFGGFSHASTTADRFRLSASLILKTGPRLAVTLLDPARLFRDFLSELPCSPEQARQVVAGWGTEPDIDEFRIIADPFVLMTQLERIEHLLPADPDRTIYEEWRQIWEQLFKTDTPTERTEERKPLAVLREGTFIDDDHRRRLERFADQVETHLQTAGFPVIRPPAWDVGGVGIEINIMPDAPGVYVYWYPSPAWHERMHEHIIAGRFDHPEILRRHEVGLHVEKALAGVIHAFGLETRYQVFEQWQGLQVLDPAEKQQHRKTAGRPRQPLPPGPGKRAGATELLLEESALVLTEEQSSIIREAVNMMLRSYSDPLFCWLGFGAEEARVRKFLETSARVPLDDAHLVHCALITSTKWHDSEIEYKEMTGYFREEAIRLAATITDAVAHLRLEELPETITTAPKDAALRLALPSAHLVHASLAYLLDHPASNPRLWLGVDASVAREFHAALVSAVDKAKAAEKASFTYVPVEASKAHLAYCAVILAPKIATSEAEYYSKLGFFTDNARSAAMRILRASSPSGQAEKQEPS